MKWVRTAYLSLFSFLDLVLLVISATRRVILGLKTCVFTKADEMVRYPEAKPILLGKEGAKRHQALQEKIAVFQKAQQMLRRQHEAAGALGLIIVGLPVCLYH